MATTVPNSNFALNSVGDKHTFIYTRDKYGFVLGTGIFLLICLLSAVSLLFTDSLIKLGWIGFFIFSIGLATAFILLANYFLREEGTFTVNSSEIIVGGQSYKREHVRRLAVVTPKGQIARSSNIQSGTVILGGPAIAVGAAVAAHHAANASKEVLDNIITVIGDGFRDVNNKMTFQYGNKEIKLAGGMSEKNALYMYDRLVEIMD